MIDYADYDWYCNNCKTYLNGQRGFSPYCGTWTCKSCGEINNIDESEIIDENEFSAEDEFVVKNYHDDIPEGCDACGGDYPHCKESCPLWDD